MNTENATRIVITLSDPWDLGESLKWQPLPGELLKTEVDPHGGRVLIRLSQPITYRGVAYQFVVAVPRHKGGDVDEIKNGKKLFCSFTGVSEEHARSDNALSTLDWRGGLAFIGDIQAPA